MPTLEDYTSGWTTGLQIGANIGRSIAAQRQERERLARLVEQTKFANEITLRDQAIQEAEAARKAQEFQQVQDFAALVRQTTPGGGDFEAMAPEDQAQARATMRQGQIAQAPPSLLPKLLGQEQSDFEKDQRLGQTLQGMESRRAANQAEIDARKQLGIDAKIDEQNARIAAAEKAAKQAQDAAMERAKFTQGQITTRGGMRRQAVVEVFPTGTPAAIYEDLLSAKEAGGEAGAIKGDRYKEGAREGLFTGPTQLDKLIEQYAPKVPAATKRRIEAKVKAGESQESPETEGEPAAIPVPTESQPAPAARVRVISPDGKSVGTIPAEKLDEALKRGYKRAD